MSRGFRPVELRAKHDVRERQSDRKARSRDRQVRQRVRGPRLQLRRMEELAAGVDERVDLGSDALDFLFADVDEVRIVRRQPLLERSRQRTRDVGREVAALHEVLLKERNDTGMARRVDVAGRQQGAGGMEGRVVVAVGGTTVRVLLGEKVAFSAGRVRAFDAMAGDDVRFRTHNATPSRVTVCTNNVVRHTGSARDSAVTTRGEI